MAASPLGIAFLVEALLEFRQGTGARTLLYLACSGLTIAVYLPLAIQLGAWIGLRVRGRGRAILAVLGSLAAVIFAVPELVRILIRLAQPGSGALGNLNYLHLLSPATIVQLNETESWRRFAGEPAWAIVALNFAIYAGLLLWLRRWTLRNADRLLGRIPEPVTRRG
jgi:hypothetical protein